MHDPQRYSHPTREVIREHFAGDAGGTNGETYGLFRSRYRTLLRRLTAIITTAGGGENDGFAVKVNGVTVHTMTLGQSAPGYRETEEIAANVAPFDTIEVEAIGTVKADLIFEYRHIPDIEP